MVVTKDLGALPVAAALLVNRGVEIRLEVAFKVLFSLLFQLEAVHQKKNAFGVAGAQKDAVSAGQPRSCRCRWPVGAGSGFCPVSQRPAPHGRH